MIPILKVLVLAAFAALAFALAFHKEQHHISHRLILAFVALGTTTFLPEEAIGLQIITGVSVYFFFSALLTVVAGIRNTEKSEEKNTVHKA